MNPLTEHRLAAGALLQRGQPDGDVPRATPRDALPGLLAWAFAFFNSARLLSYLPTLWAIHEQGDASQHSLIMWLTWVGANATMALWLYEQNARQLNGAVIANACNAAMCFVTAALILLQRV